MERAILAVTAFRPRLPAHTTRTKKATKGEPMNDRMFKRLSRDNWREEEPHIQLVSITSASGVQKTPSADDIAAEITAPELSDRVPRNIQELFEVAQGAMCYGSLFYPMFTLGNEQMWRVMEAALMTRAEELGAPSTARKSFSAALNWFNKKSLMPADRVDRWKAAKDLRNMSSHTKRQSLFDATMAMRAVASAQEFIDELYTLDGQGPNKNVS